MARATKKTKEVKESKIATFFKKLNYKIIGFVTLFAIAALIVTLVIFKYIAKEDETVYRFIGEETITNNEIVNILDTTKDSTGYEYEIYIYVYDSDYETCTRCEQEEGNIYTLIEVANRLSNVGVYLLDVKAGNNANILNNSDIGPISSPSIIRITGEKVDKIYSGATMTAYLKQLLPELNNR